MDNNIINEQPTKLEADISSICESEDASLEPLDKTKLSAHVSGDVSTKPACSVIVNEQTTKTDEENSTKKQLVKKLRYIDSGSKSNTSNSESDSDNIPPVSHLIKKRKLSSMNVSDSDSGLDRTYKPSSKELNSSDSEYSSDASETTKRDRKRKEKSKRLFEKVLKKSQRPKFHK